MEVFLVNLLFSLIALFCVRIGIVFLRIHNTKKTVITKRRTNCKTLIVMGSGGHTYEMIQLVSELGDHYAPVIYIIAETDKTSEAKVHKLESEKLNRKVTNESLNVIERIPRSREVNQPWFSTLISTLYATIYSLKFVFKHQPDLILCNGPGTCVPICIAAFLIHVLCIKRITIIYVESICRVETLSLSGKILYLFADHFIVQWSGLLEKYPRAKYMGQLVS